MTLTYVGPTIGDGDLIVPAAQEAALDPLLAEAVLLWRSAGVGPSITGEGTALLDGTGNVPEPKRLTSASWAGSRLVGLMSLDADYDATGDWFTDLDFRWTASVLPHHSNNPAAQWAEVVNIPVTGSGLVRDYLEVGFVLKDEGDVLVGVDWDSAGEGDPGSWQSASVGTWDAGIPEADWRVTIVAATGAVTVYRDGDVVDTDTIGATTFPEPADGGAVTSGAQRNAIAVMSWDLLDGIDGDPILSFDSTDTTGWSGDRGGVVSAPARRALLGQSATTGWSVADPADLDIGAGDSVSWAISFRPLPTTQATFFARNANGLFGGQAGWAFVHAPGFGISNSFILGPGGGPPVTVSLGAFASIDTAYIVILDRDDDTLTSYDSDGVQIAQADASSVGAVSPDSAVTAFGGPCFGYLAAVWLTAVDPVAVAAAL